MICLFAGKEIAYMGLIRMGLSAKQAWLMQMIINHAIRTDMQVPDVLSSELETLNITFNQLMQDRETDESVPH